MRHFVLALLVTISMTSISFAGDKEDVAAASDALSTAWSGTDVDVIARHYAPGYTRYSPDGGLLIPGGWQWEGLAAWFESGGKVLVAPARHRDIAMFGSTAIVTQYGTVTVTQPDGTAVTRTARNTGVWVKQGNTWKAAHGHASRLTPLQPN